MSKGDKQELRSLAVGERIEGEVVKIWAATRNENRTDGWGKRIDNSYHLTSHEALIATKGIDVMGSDGEVESRMAVRLSDGRYFLAFEPVEITRDPEAEARLREQALAKLTKPEIAAILGKRR